MGLLTIQQMQEHVSKLSYKDWKIEVYQGIFEGPHLKITAILDDSVELGKKTTFIVNSSIDPQLSIEQFNLYLLNRLMRIESHECREWFKMDGVALFYPHCELADRDEYEHYLDYQKVTFDAKEIQTGKAA